MNILCLGADLNTKVAASLFASTGNHVFISEKEQLDKKFITESGLQNLYEKQIAAERINQFKIEDYQNIEIIILSSHDVFELFKSIHESCIVKTKETKFAFIMTPSKVGESQELESSLNQRNIKVHVGCLSVLIREGRAIADLSRPENLIIGADNQQSFEMIESLLYPFNRVKNIIKRVSSKEAEFTCFVSHAMLATRLSFMNEMASLAEKVEVDIETIRECIGLDPRIGHEYLYPGCGYGGRALEENVNKVASQLKARNDDLGLLDIVSKINDRQKDLLFRKIWKFFKGELTGKTIAIWGVTFKPQSSTIIGAPSINLIESLLAQSAKIVIYDPMGMQKVLDYFDCDENIKSAESANKALQDADVLAICCEWKEFWSPDYNQLNKRLKYKAIFDGRNILDPLMTNNYQIKYFGIGRGNNV